MPLTFTVNFRGKALPFNSMRANRPKICESPLNLTFRVHTQGDGRWIKDAKSKRGDP